jgi:hypothetical protein
MVLLIIDDSDLNCNNSFRDANTMLLTEQTARQKAKH